MRKLTAIITVGIMFMALQSEAQQLPRFAFEYINPYYVHPAAAGYLKGSSVSLGFREQWSGTSFQGKNPQTIMGNFHTRIIPARLGIGLGVTTDRMGDWRFTGGNLALVYHLKLDRDDRFQLGMGLGGRFSMVTFDNVEAVTQLGGDEVLSNTDNSFTADASASIFVTGEGLKAGFSAKNLFDVYMNLSDATNRRDAISKHYRHYHFTASYEYYFSNAFGIEPMFGMRTMFTEKIQFDFGGRVILGKTFWLGSLIRFGGQGESVAGMMGVTIKDKLTVGYSYDYTFSNLMDVTHGSHEATIKLNFVKD